MQNTSLNFDKLPDAAYVGINYLTMLYGCSTATIWRRVASGHLPHPKKFGKRTTRWNVAKIRESLTGA